MMVREPAAAFVKTFPESGKLGGKTADTLQNDRMFPRASRRLDGRQVCEIDKRGAAVSSRATKSAPDGGNHHTAPMQRVALLVRQPRRMCTRSPARAGAA